MAARQWWPQRFPFCPTASAFQSPIRILILENSRENLINLFSLNLEKSFLFLVLVSKHKIDRKMFSSQTMKVSFLSFPCPTKQTKTIRDGIRKINLQSLEDTQVGYILQKYTLDKYTLERAF